MKTLIVIGMGMFLSIPILNAQNDKKEKEEKQTAAVVSHPGYTDENKDGVCDNYNEHHLSGKGYAYVDENNDGVCDHYNNGNGHRHGNGYGHNRHHHHHHGNHYGYNRN